MSDWQVYSLALLGAAAGAAAVIEIVKRTILGGMKRQAKLEDASEDDRRAYEKSMGVLLIGVAVAVVPLGHLVAVELGASGLLGGVSAGLGGLLARPLYAKVIDPSMGAVADWIRRKLGGDDDDPPPAPSCEIEDLPALRSASRTKSMTDTWIGR